MGHCAHISPPWSHDFTGPTWTRNQYEFSLNGLARVTYPPRTERPLAGCTGSYRLVVLGVSRVRMRTLNVPVPQVSRNLYDTPRVARFEGDM